MLFMRDQNDCDLTFYLYQTIEFIESALSKNPTARILVHCFKVIKPSNLFLGKFEIGLASGGISHVEAKFGLFGGFRLSKVKKRLR